MAIHIYVNACGTFTDHVLAQDVDNHILANDQHAGEASVLKSFLDSDGIPCWAQFAGYKAGGKVYVAELQGT